MLLTLALSILMGLATTPLGTGGTRHFPPPPGIMEAGDTREDPEDDVGLVGAEPTGSEPVPAGGAGGIPNQTRLRVEFEDFLASTLAPYQAVFYFQDATFSDHNHAVLHESGATVIKTRNSTSSHGTCKIVAVLPSSTSPDLVAALRGCTHVEARQRIQPQMRHLVEQVGVKPRAWTQLGVTGDPHSSLVVIDSSGIDDSHEAFAGKLKYWKDFTESPMTSAQDFEGHASAVASVAVANAFNSTDALGRWVSTESVAFDGTRYNLSGSLDWVSTMAAFNVSQAGIFSLAARWDNASSSTAAVTKFYLSRPDGTSFLLDTPLENQEYSGTWEVPAAHLGTYTVQVGFRVFSTTKPTFNALIEAHYPVANATGTPVVAGVAPDSGLIVLRALWEDEVEDAMNWIIEHKQQYNITAVNLSFKLAGTQTDVIARTNLLVSHGIVVVAAAGNDGPGRNYAGNIDHAPGSADYTISVGATGANHSLASYSAQGGPTSTGHTTKPDLVAPGGEFPVNATPFLPLEVVDSNDGDLGTHFLDKVGDDTRLSVGTSYSAPAVAGAAQLVVDALGGADRWNHTVTEALRVKALLLMTATETWPATRHVSTTPYQSPTLERGAKDNQEGYGRLNAAAAASAVLTPVTAGGSVTGTLYAVDAGRPTAPACWAAHLDLDPAYTYNLTASVPAGADFDLYLYDLDGTSVGDPVIYNASTTPGVGLPEGLHHVTVTSLTRKIVVVKAVQGAGQFNLTITRALDVTVPELVHLLSVETDLDDPAYFVAGDSSIFFYALDRETGVARVELWATDRANQTRYVTQTTNISGHLLAWDSRALPDGNHSLYLVARDFAGNARNSTSVFVIVDNGEPHPVRLALLRSNALLGTFLLEGHFMDNTTRVTRVRVVDFANSTVLHARNVSGGTTTIRFRWQTREYQDGVHTLYLVATDLLGNTGISAYLSLTVDNYSARVASYWVGGILVLVLAVVHIFLLKRWDVLLIALVSWDRLHDALRDVRAHHSPRTFLVTILREIKSYLTRLRPRR